MAGLGISGIESLDRMIATVRGVGEGPEYAQATARATEAWLRSQLAAGVDPNTGAPWKLTEQGKRPLKSAVGRPIVRLAGNVVIISLRGHYVFQHFGVRGRAGRRVIPQGSMPAQLGDAIRLGLVEPFRAKARGK